nr:hypothetical protein [Tanacetum cinerariifolium]
MTKYLANHLYLKKKLYTYNMHPDKSQSEHIDEFHKLETSEDDEAKGDGGEGFYTRGRFHQRDIEQGQGCPWSKSQGRSNSLKCYICQVKDHLKRDCLWYNHKKSQDFVKNKNHVSGFGADVYDSAYVMVMSVE